MLRGIVQRRRCHMVRALRGDLFGARGRHGVSVKRRTGGTSLRETPLYHFIIIIQGLNTNCRFSDTACYTTIPVAGRFCKLSPRTLLPFPTPHYGNPSPEEARRIHAH